MVKVITIIKSVNFVTEHNFVTTTNNFWLGLDRFLLMISIFLKQTANEINFSHEETVSSGPFWRSRIRYFSED